MLTLIFFRQILQNICFKNVIQGVLTRRSKLFLLLLDSGILTYPQIQLCLFLCVCNTEEKKIIIILHDISYNKFNDIQPKTKIHKNRF